MSIKQWPETERPQEKLLARGADKLSDAELLALFIRSGTNGRTAIDVGRDLLSEFGGLRQILAADQKTLCKQNGIGPVKFVLLQAALEIGRRFLDQDLRKGDPITSAKQAASFLTHQLRDKKREVFAVLYLDAKHRVVDYEELFVGSLSSATVHPREVVKGALEKNASSVILAHNHPSGVAEPSASDANLTKRLKEALGLIDVKLLDHLVIGDGQFVSMNDRGLF